MKCCHGFRPLLLLVLVFASALHSVQAAERPVAASSNAARADQLAADVRELATAPGLSRAKREKRIATAVRTAVVAATAYRSDSAAVLGAATELAIAATGAAPAYAEVIAKAAALAPGVSRIDGAAGSIRAAAAAGAKGGKTPRVAAGRKAAHVARRAPVEAEPAPREPAEPAVAEADPGSMASSTDDLPTPERTGRRGRNAVEDPAFAVSATLDVSARHDSNIFQASTNEVADTIISAKPGFAVRWGDKSHTHGSLGYAEAFEHYQNGTSPNVSLGTGALDYVFEGAASTGAVNANYQQLNQSNSDLQSTGTGAIVRSDVASASASFEANPWAKIGGRLGVNYGSTKYTNSGLIGNRQVGVPVDAVFNLTPKTDLSLGYVYSTQRPDGGGESSKDHYLNVGARGQFTAKLGGSFNLGYQTRRVGANPSEHMLGFNSNLSYELTPRLQLNLGANRNFNASALGATTKNSSYQLGLTGDLSPQWRVGATATYSDNEYGAGVFRADQFVPQVRTDRLWEGTFTASYLFTEWFSTSASYLLRKNNSTLSSIEFSDNVLSLTLGLKY